MTPKDFPFADEDAFHEAVVILLRDVIPPDVVWFSVPNHGFRHIVTAKKLKRMGLRAGVSDLILYGRGVVLALELKKPKGVQSDDQIGFQAAWERSGGIYVIARSLSDVWAILWKYGLV